jgi:hypothetical protein
MDECCFFFPNREGFPGRNQSSRVFRRFVFRVESFSMNCIRWK